MKTWRKLWMEKKNMLCEKKKESTVEAFLVTTVVIYMLPILTQPRFLLQVNF